MSFLPWHAANRARLQTARANGRLPHALLLSGQDGLGKDAFATATAAWLLCSDGAEGQRCGRCHACGLFAAGTHPDLFVLEPEEDRRTIVIEQVRDLIDTLNLSSRMGGYKVAIVGPADALTLNAQNSLLKTLEEPPRETLLMLVSSRVSRLLPTIVSRCQQLRFASPDRSQARRWLAERRTEDTDWDALLAFAAGAPLRALALAEADFAAENGRLAEELVALMRGRRDPVTTAAAWAGRDAAVALHWLYRQVSGLVLWRMAGGASDAVHPLLRTHLQKVFGAISLIALYRHLDDIIEATALLQEPVNTELMLAGLLAPWANGPRFTAIDEETA